MSPAVALIGFDAVLCSELPQRAAGAASTLAAVCSIKALVWRDRKKMQDRISVCVVDNERYHLPNQLLFAEVAQGLPPEQPYGLYLARHGVKRPNACPLATVELSASSTSTNIG
ncbi:hypothetical protein PHSY_004081 [Pseudozyma hubeiensis SY62]|uniref:Uncharacterized protein n=1 Tax=Pseudozyma hubeiensis (strain SY62) TaxID=1305764 RepID=R9P562_PSEHS|nr:hypothetical protein PHSY_004081 [Pseudozyma hubeiensis SY62]GAC96501.1 hypothetical protein PHSY_004081 [Pseudozyma hubeiensis SY62]